MMLVEIPDQRMPKLMKNGRDSGEQFREASVGYIDCLLLARQMIQDHPDDLDEYLADFLIGIKTIRWGFVH